ncbi:MAG: carbohydrate-binding family 9-like protein [Rubripirellula sp.]
MLKIRRYLQRDSVCCHRSHSEFHFLCRPWRCRLAWQLLLVFVSGTSVVADDVTPQGDQPDAQRSEQFRTTKVARSSTPIVIDGKRDEAAWAETRPLDAFVFTWWKLGDGDRQPTDARMLWDERYLYVSFHCDDSRVEATREERDSPVYRDDCVEVFASPVFDHPERYFNLEINALGTVLDNYRPDGNEPKTPWDAEGLLVATTVDGSLNKASDVDRGWTVEVAIPFALFPTAIPGGTPQVGDRWRLNLHRLEDNMAIKSQWSRGDESRPIFHTPELFGTIEFVDEQP